MEDDKISASDMFKMTYERIDDIDFHYMGIVYNVNKSAYINIDRVMRVGCIIVKDNAIISSGYNNIEGHAEKTAIDKCKWKNIDTKAATLYTNLQPCPECTELIIESKIKRVVYSFLYPKSKYDKDIDLDILLCKNGIEVIFIPLSFITLCRIDVCKNLEMRTNKDCV